MKKLTLMYEDPGTKHLLSSLSLVGGPQLTKSVLARTFHCIFQRIPSPPHFKNLTQPHHARVQTRN